jgi:hypothetical protein
MKISYRTHSILKKIEERKLGKIAIRQENDGIQNYEPLMSEMRQNFNNYAPYFGRKVQIITKPFAEAIDLAKPKMIADELFRLSEQESGTIFLPSGLTFLYYFSPFSLVEGDYGDHLFFTFLDDCLIGYSRQKSNDEQGLFCFVCKGFLNESHHLLESQGFKGQSAMVNEIDSQFSTLIMAIINFIKYCPVETTHLNPKGKSKDILCKYVNDTSTHIDIYDSKWFTTLVKSDAFKVRGHFRLQPCGEGLKDRKLIWVNEFQKSGYTAPARKLNADL